MTATAPKPLPWGFCVGCDRSYHLTAKGVIRVHNRGRSGGVCPGSGMPPRDGVR